LALSVLLTAESTRADDAQAIQGTWQVVSFKFDGKTIPPDYRVIVTGDTITFQNADGTTIPPVPKYKIGSTASPKEIDMTSEDNGVTRISAGIYALDGDSLQMCYPKPGMARPKKFETAEGDMIVVVMLKRVK
jgi:uncharacterized protein (TIGR03067 family)